MALERQQINKLLAQLAASVWLFRWLTGMMANGRLKLSSTP